MLAIKALNQFYGGSHTLWDVDLHIPAGARMCLNGAQWNGQDYSVEMHHGATGNSVGRNRFRRRGSAENVRGATG